MALKSMTAMSRIIRMQLITGTMGCVLLFGLGYGVYAASFAYGAVLMSVNAWWLARRLGQTEDLDAEASQRSLFAGAALRFVALIAGLLLAQLLGLHLMLVAAGIFVAQVLIYVFALVELRKEQFK